MAAKRTPSYVVELPLLVQPGNARVLLARFEAGKRLYNAVLGEALRRLDRMRESKAWQAARCIPARTPGDGGPNLRAQAFQACQRQFGVSDFDLQSVATLHKNAAGFAGRLGAHETQKTATRVFEAVEKYLFGQRGRPRFKGVKRPLHSLEGKSNVTGIRWNAAIGCVTWNKLALPALLPSQRQDPYLYQALKDKTKYCRILWRHVRGEKTWFVQLVQEGAAPAKYDFLAKGEKVSLDIGPSSVAMVSEHVVGLERFAPSVDQPWRAIKVLQRAQDRSRRATNPDNFDGQGRARKGCKVWKKSERYQKRQAELAGLERRLAAARKTDHGNLANRVIGLGTVVPTEKLSFKAFQRSFGRSVKVRAPGLFISLLTRKAESAGGAVVNLDTRRLRMSQYDHVLDACEKKPLSQRWHRLGGGPTLVQRDCYSAFLARFAEGSEHNPSRLAIAWAAAEPLLRRAGLCLDSSASGRAPAVPTAPLPSERIARRRRFGRGQTSDAVGVSREPKTPLAVHL